MKKRLCIILMAFVMAFVLIAPSVLAEDASLAAKYGFTSHIIGDGTQSITMLNYQNWNTSAYYDSPDGLLIENLLEDITGVKVNWECVDFGDYETVAQTRLASGMNLPDILRLPVVTGVVTKYADEGLLLKMSDYINEDITPNICKLFEKYPLIKAMATAPDGNIYALPYLEWDVNEVVVYWNSIRQDWLDNLGLSMPTTIDEYHNVLLAFKEKDANGNGDPNDEIPLGYSTDQMFGLYGLKGAYGMPFGKDIWSVNEGKVQLDLVDPRIKDLLITLNQWYKEGLLYTEVDNSGMVDVISQDLLGGQTMLASDNLMSYNGYAYSANPNCNYVYTPLLSNEQYPVEKPQLYKRSTGMWGYFAATTDAKDPELVMRWIDYVWASEESKHLRYYGLEGVTYEMVDGKEKFLDSITQTENGAIAEMRTLGAWPNFLGNESGDAFMAMYAGQYPEKARDEFSPYFIDWVPVVLGTPEEDSILARYWTDLEIYVKESFVGFVTGTKSLDEFDSYVQTCYDMGLDKVLEVRQAWYDRSSN